MAQDSQSSTQQFDAGAFLNHLDALFDAKQATTQAEPYMLESLKQAKQLHDEGAQLTILNELMGFYRSQSMHEKGVKRTQEALDLITTMGIEGTAAATTTLINAATEYRAAKKYDLALPLYQKALKESARTLKPTDRKLAALHNNLSIAYSDLNRYSDAQKELETALKILTDSSPDPSTDIDVASTHANLALVCYRNHQPAQASSHVESAMRIFSAGRHKDASHFSSALAAAGEAFFHMGKYAESISSYVKALDLIERSYGTDNEYYTITAQNLAAVRQAAGREAGGKNPQTDAKAEKTGAPEAQKEPPTSETASAEPHADISGMKLSREYWEQCGKPMLERKYPQLLPRIAAGLVGHGSEVYGFDDELSRDHDFAPRFCIWLTTDDYAKFGEALQKDYDDLPQEFMGYSRSGIQRTPRSQGSGRRDGVFSIPEFYESITGYAQCPGDGEDAVQWLLLDEASLAAATNGSVFADPLGQFSQVRAGFKAMPDDVRLSLISRRLGMLSQAGQYNFPRMIARGDGSGAWRSLNEFVHTAASTVFLINGASAVGYLPYYKWEMAALQRISGRMGTRLNGVAAQLIIIMENASSACFSDNKTQTGAKSPSNEPLGDYRAPHSPSADLVFAEITNVCNQVRSELKREHLVTGDETFLEWLRPQVEEGISNPQLKSL